MNRRVFLSYARDVATYVEEFAPIFRPPAGDPELYFYGDTPIPAGNLPEGNYSPRVGWSRAGCLGGG
jgi:hypothetical protein